MTQAVARSAFTSETLWDVRFRALVASRKERVLALVCQSLAMRCQRGKRCNYVHHFTTYALALRRPLLEFFNLALGAQSLEQRARIGLDMGGQNLAPYSVLKFAHNEHSGSFGRRSLGQWRVLRDEKGLRQLIQTRQAGAQIGFEQASKAAAKRAM